MCKREKKVKLKKEFHTHVFFRFIDYEKRVRQSALVNVVNIPTTKKQKIHQKQQQPFTITSFNLGFFKAKEIYAVLHMACTTNRLCIKSCHLKCVL